VSHPREHLARHRAPGVTDAVRRASSRTKIVDVVGDDPAVLDRLLAPCA